jgi:hypothetical protein
MFIGTVTNTLAYYDRESIRPLMCFRVMTGEGGALTNFFTALIKFVLWQGGVSVTDSHLNPSQIFFGTAANPLAFYATKSNTTLNRDMV